MYKKMLLYGFFVTILLFGCTAQMEHVQNNESILEPNTSDERSGILPEDNVEKLDEEESSQEELNAEGQAWEKRIDAALQTDSCPVPPNRYSGKKYYNGPLIDTHIHMAPLPDSSPYEEVTGDGVRPILGYNINIEDYICMMNYENTTKAFAFFAVWDPIIPQSLALVNRTLEKYPDRFVPFIMTPDHDDRPDGFPTVNAITLGEMLSVYPGMFDGYGEIGLYARGDHGGPKGSPELPPDSARLREIYPIVREHNLLVYVHLGEGQAESFERALSANPDINFIWHGDQLIEYEAEGQNLEIVEGILSRHPNAYYGVDELYGDTWLIRPEGTKEEFLEHFQDYEPLLAEDLKTWKGFIERHPEQVLWGTDRGWSSPWSLDPEVALVLNNYSRTFIGHLDRDVQEKFAYKNAEKLIQEVND